MATTAQSLSRAPSSLLWFWQFLKGELTPYPGRAQLVTRITVAASIVMVVTTTFRIPFGDYAAIYTLLISRESPTETVQSAITEASAFLCSILYTLIGAMLFVNHPLLRLLWIIATLFLMFYALRAMTNYKAAVRFGWLMVITIPLWDKHITAEAKLEGTLWAAGALVLASLVTVAVELSFAALRPAGDELVSPLAERLDAVEKLLNAYSTGSSGDEKAEEQIARMAILGTSNLRRILQRSSYAPHYVEQMGAAVVLVGRLVDVAANVRHLATYYSANDRQRIQDLAQNVSGIREDLLNGRIPRLIHPATSVPQGSPLIAEMERTVSLITEIFTGSQSLCVFASKSLSHGDPRPTLFVRDALSNPEHAKFALKGCLAASLCYIIYNGADWPGIGTAVTTCFVTALSTVGASRQKQFLRIVGAIAGGALAIGIQVFILPQLDSIAGFTVLFSAIIFGAAWVTAAGPRLSYAGLQAAVTFCIINLQSFRIQTDLAPARDRVAGVLLGLFMMWLVFDQLWGVPALGQMRKTFISTLRLLAKFAKEPLSQDAGVAADRSYSIRETINNNFQATRALADGVLFEFGASRQRGLLWRNRIVQWQPRVRVLFLTRIALWKYRAQLPGFELPEAIQAAQQEFDHKLAEKLEAMADCLEGKGALREQTSDNLLERLEQTIQVYSVKKVNVSFAARFQAFLGLCRTAEKLTLSLDNELKVSQACTAD